MVTDNLKALLNPEIIAEKSSQVGADVDEFLDERQVLMVGKAVCGLAGELQQIQPILFSLQSVSKPRIQ